MARPIHSCTSQLLISNSSSYYPPLIRSQIYIPSSLLFPSSKHDPNHLGLWLTARSQHTKCPLTIGLAGLERLWASHVRRPAGVDTAVAGLCPAVSEPAALRRDDLPHQTQQLPGAQQQQCRPRKKVLSRLLLLARTHSRRCHGSNRCCCGCCVYPCYGP